MHTINVLVQIGTAIARLEPSFFLHLERRWELYGSYRMHNYLFHCLAKHLINQFFHVLRIRHRQLHLPP